MLTREIRANYLRSKVAGTRVDLHALPAVLPPRISEKTIQRFNIKIALALEVVIESAVRQPRARHDLVERNLLKAMAIKKSASALDDLLFHFVSVSFWIRNGTPS